MYGLAQHSFTDSGVDVSERINNMVSLLNRTGKCFTDINGYIVNTIKKLRLERIFLVLGLMLGLFYSIVLPPGQVPDERTHWNFAKEAYGFYTEEDEVDWYFQKIGFYEYFSDPALAQDIDALKAGMKIHFSDEARSIVRPPSLSAVKYFPAGIVMSIGILLNLPIFWIMTLSELTAVLFYVVMGYYALKHMPVMKEVLFVIMLLPMTLQQCTTINYDAVLMPVSFWMLSYLLHLIYSTEEVGWKQVIPLFISGFVVLLIKPPVVLILLLFFTIDRTRVRLNIGSGFELYSFICGHKLLIFLCIVAAGAAGVYILRDNSYIRLLYISLQEPGKTVSIFTNTIRDYATYYVNTLAGNFGWLAMPMPFGFVLLVYITILSVSLCAYNNIKIGTPVRIVSIITVIIVIMLVMLALLPWVFHLLGVEINSITYEELYSQFLNVMRIEGVQGRYFIPILPVLALSFGGIIRNGKKYFSLINVILFCWMNIWACAALVDRFWIS